MRLKKISVDGLFDRFSYEIALNLDPRITILISPNGYGKTMILRIIDAFFNRSPRALTNFPFRELRLDFDNEATVSVLKKEQEENQKSSGAKTDLEITYIKQGKPAEDFIPKQQTNPERLDFPIGIIEDLIPELDQIEAQSWRHRGTGKILFLDDVLDRYSDELPSGERRFVYDLPDWLQDIRKAIPVRFINTERLYTSSPRRRASHYSPSLTPEPAVRGYAAELGNTIKQTLTQYGTLSQSLDRTFPVRLVSETPESPPTMDTLREKLAEIERKRTRLVEAGLLDKEPEGLGRLSLDKVDKTKLEVLSVYAQDAEKKLGVFDDVFSRVGLLKKLVNTRFFDKEIVIGQSGFEFVTSNGTQLSPVLLSSGEQHEVVLLYELLFKVKDNSVILIDEPEISLHVAWQEEFLKDLSEMAEVSRFQALIGTHSPQIINDRWDLTVELESAPE